MKKYYLNNGQEVHIGDTIKRTGKVKLPFGSGKTTDIFTITEDNLKTLIDNKVITEIEIPEKKKRRKKKTKQCNTNKCNTNINNILNTNVNITKRLIEILNQYDNNIDCTEKFKEFEKLVKKVSCPVEDKKNKACINNNIINNKKDSNYKGFSLNKNFYIEKFIGKAFFDELEKIDESTALRLLLKTIANVINTSYPDSALYSKNLYTISMYDGSIVELNKKCITTLESLVVFRSFEDAAFAKYVLRDYFRKIFNITNDRK